MKNWQLDGDVLKLSSHGELLNVSVEQIYTTFIESSPNMKNQKYLELGVVSKLAFSKNPVKVYTIPQIDNSLGKIVVRFIAQSQMGDQFYISKSALFCGHVVNKNTWFPLDPSSPSDTQDLLHKFDVDIDTGEIKTFRGIINLRKEALKVGLTVDNLSDDALKKVIFERTKISTPIGINAILYPYQCDGWRWINFVIQEQLGGILGDEMGLGKTLQIICALNNLFENINTNALIIAPGSLLENWIREFTKFSPKIHILKHHGPERTGSPAELKKYKVVLTSYDSIIRDISLFRMLNWNVVVLDEAQNIKNPNSIRAKAVKKLPRNAGVAVTGTPIENSIIDLWSIMDFIVPNYLGDLKSYITNYSDIGSTAELEPLVKPLILRRRVSEVATELPKRIDITELLEMQGDESLKYEETRLSIKSKLDKSVTLVTLNKLRQYCAHPELIGVYNANNWTNFTKFKRLQELLEEIFSLKEKVIVFTSFRAMANKIVNMTKNKFNLEANYLDGRIKTDERQPVIDKFELNPNSALLVLNPRAGGTGLNITAANHVIHYNPEWNPAIVDQASARAYRRGQTQPVTVRHLIYLNTVENVILERLNRKRKIANSTILGVKGNESDFTDIIASLERSPYIH